MPSSSELVVTSAGQLARLERPLELETPLARHRPWYGRASSAPASSLRRAAIRSACARLFTKTSVVRAPRDRLQRERDDRRPDRPPNVREVGDGRADGEVHRFDQPAVDDLDRRGMLVGRRGAAVRAARSRRGTARSRRAAAGWPRADALRSVAPDADAERVEPLERRARDATPRLVPATAWISSTITARTPGKSVRPALRREQDVERFRRRDQDVRRDAQHPRARRRLGVAGPDGHADLGKRLARAASNRSRELGERLLEVAVDVVAERLERRDVEDLHGVRERRRAVRRSIRALSSHRNAARVFPVPVGARISVCAPDAIAGHPRTCGALGWPSVSVNHWRTSGWNAPRGTSA